jgi:2-keto-4-pentenoate hydratase/2-oxohepta-3-ene-1,7-dioic acid hydratase in catechol pathway
MIRLFENTIVRITSALIIIVISCYLYLNRALPQHIHPAAFSCLEEEDGHFLEEDYQFTNIYGVGLAYANHINETASEFDFDIGPPVFRKALLSITMDESIVDIPSPPELQKSVEELETGITDSLRHEGIELSTLLDHEVELAFVLLENISQHELNDSNFTPKIGFFIANDLSARSVAVLGEGQQNRYDYWGASKSFPGFTPISSRIWVPRTNSPNAIPCVTLQTHVNGDLRQSESTNNLIYRPVDMLRFIQQRYPFSLMTKGDIVLTGTPGGVIFNIPRWKARAAKILGLNRFLKLAFAQNKASAEAFLQAGDNVRVSGEWLGDVTVTIAK